MNKIAIMFVMTGILLFSCEKEDSVKRNFTSSFENVSDFDGFYISPQNYLNTTSHELSDSIAHTGTYSHRAWVYGANPPSTLTTNNNHRGYPTVQLYKTTDGSFQTPCYVTLWVWLDMSLQQASSSDDQDDWFSFATFTDVESDSWNRTVLVNLSYDGFVHLMHTTNQGEKDHIFQTTTIKFPQKEWVELKIYLDFSNDGYAKVWQNGELVSYADIGHIKNRVAQAHFGMYCPPQIETGEVYNDDLKIEMVSNE